jgi:hypothetical protein
MKGIPQSHMRPWWEGLVDITCRSGRSWLRVHFRLGVLMTSTPSDSRTVSKPDVNLASRS